MASSCDQKLRYGLEWPNIIQLTEATSGINHFVTCFVINKRREYSLLIYRKVSAGVSGQWGFPDSGDFRTLGV